jgi:hypothetical protein
MTIFRYEDQFYAFYSAVLFSRPFVVPFTYFKPKYPWPNTFGTDNCHSLSGVLSWQENLNKRDLYLDGRIILKCMLGRVVSSIHLAQGKDKFQDVVNMAINLRVQ